MRSAPWLTSRRTTVAQAYRDRAAAGRRPAGHHRLPPPLRSPCRGRDRPRGGALVGGSEPHHRHDRQLPAADRSGSGAAGPVPPGAAGRGGDDHRTDRSGGSAQPGPGPGGRPRAAAGPRTGRPAGVAEVPPVVAQPRHPAPAAETPVGAAAGPTRPPSQRPTTSSGSSCGKPAEPSTASPSVRSSMRPPDRGRAGKLRRRHVPRSCCPTGPTRALSLPAGAEAGGVLVGTPASAGNVTGGARVVIDPWGPTSSRTRSWSPRRPTRAGHRCSSPPAAW